LIAMLRGRVVRVGEEWVILDVQGVGYRVFTPVGSGTVPGAELTLYTYLQVREDAMVLYGFALEEQLELFEALISVSGLGPKTALGALSSMDADRIRRAVLSEDLAALTKLPGVGKKTAQRLILELKDKLSLGSAIELELSAVETGEPVGEALEALVALGYAPAEAKNALGKAAKEVEGRADLESLIKSALKHIR